MRGWALCIICWKNVRANDMHMYAMYEIPRVYKIFFFCYGRYGKLLAGLW